MKTVIEMARIAGVRDDGHRFEFSEYKYLERFAEIVRADERKACARVCDDRAFQFFSESPFFVEMHGLADAIRARSNT